MAHLGQALQGGRAGIGNIAGMASTALVGWMTDLTGSPNSAMYLFAGFAVIGGLMVLRLPAQVVNR